MKRKLTVLETGEKSVTSSPHLTINQRENVKWNALPQRNGRGSKAACLERCIRNISIVGRKQRKINI